MRRGLRAVLLCTRTDAPFIQPCGTIMIACPNQRLLNHPSPCCRPAAHRAARDAAAGEGVRDAGRVRQGPLPQRPPRHRAARAPAGRRGGAVGRRRRGQDCAHVRGAAAARAGGRGCGRGRQQTRGGPPERGVPDLPGAVLAALATLAQRSRTRSGCAATNGTT